MDEQTESQQAKERRGVSGRPKVLTAVGHSCGLAAFLGVFISASAFSTDPSSGLVRFGIILAVVGIVGFSLSRWLGRNRSE